MILLKYLTILYKFRNKNLFEIINIQNNIFISFKENKNL